MIRPLIAIASLVTAPERRAALDKLLAELRPQCTAHDVPLFVLEDTEGKGSLGPWLECLAVGAARNDVTHVTFLPDDAILVPHFVETLLACIRAKPNEILCFHTNHPKAPEVKSSWYTTFEGFTAFGGTMPVSFVREHLAWRQTALRPESIVQGDEGVNLHAMATGRLIHKAVPSLVDHDLTLPSKDGNDHHAAFNYRKSLVFSPGADLSGVNWDQEPEFLGRSYQGQHWRLATDLRPECVSEDLIERMYQIDREGQPVDEGTHVVLTTPAYSAPVLAFLESRHKVVQDLAEHGIRATLMMSGGDSLVTRGRHALCHQFLQTSGTHMLFWDADIEVIDPATVRHMLATGREIIGGAYPFRDGSGSVVCNALPESKTQGVYIDDLGAMRVREVGTGFMLIERKALVRMMAAHNHLMYLADTTSFRGAPMWALFDVAIEDRRYLSEDWLFCRRHGDVYVYAPAEFRHYGMHGHSGHILKAWGMREKDAAQ